MKFNGIIERFSRTYTAMGRYLHIIQCKTIEVSTHLKMETVRRSFAVVIAFPQLKCTSNERGSKQNRHETAYNTEKTVKDPTIDILDKPHKHRSHVTVIMQCIRAAFANIFVANISAPPFWKPFVKFVNRKNFATYGSCNFT